METERWYGRFLSATRRPLFTPKEIPWFSFLLRLSGHRGYRRIRLLEHFPKTLTRNRTRDLLSCASTNYSTAPFPTASLRVYNWHLFWLPILQAMKPCLWFCRQICYNVILVCFMLLDGVFLGNFRHTHCLVMARANYGSTRSNVVSSCVAQRRSFFRNPSQTTLQTLHSDMRRFAPS
jgi:hypothetical protein